MKYLFSRFPVFCVPYSRDPDLSGFSRFLVFLLMATLLVPQAAAFDVIDIPDPHLKKAIRQTINLPDEIPITRQEMLRLRYLRVKSPELRDLTGLEYAMNLEELSLENTGIVSDLTPLSNLTSLRVLNVANNQISDIRPLAGLIDLRTLDLSDNPFEDLTSLTNLMGLKKLILTYKQVSNLKPLATLIGLTYLDLKHNRISDLNPLANLTALETLRLDSNMITNITPLMNLTALKTLRLDRNTITNITPLMNLTALETLRLEKNRITDIRPLTRLANLKELRLADNPIHDLTPLLQFEGVELDIEIDETLNLVVEVPDPNLERTIRETLFLSAGAPITQLQMRRLTRLRVGYPQLKDLTGLEYAINLETLSLGTVGMVSDLRPISNLILLRNLNLAGNQISDIRPLAKLIHLADLILSNNTIQDIGPLANLSNLTGLNLADNNLDNIDPLTDLIHLQTLNLSGNQIQNITPLANLTGLTTLILSRNQVMDLNAIAGLIGLTSLNLSRNRISDFSPLSNLVNLEELFINDNFGTDISPLATLNLIEFRYDAICHIAPFTPSTTERIKSRSFPSVFRAWTGLRGLENKTLDERASLHDLAFDALGSRFDIGLEWLLTETESTFGLSTQVGGNLEQAHEARRIRRQLNPNSVNLISISWYATGFIDRFPLDSEFWLRDENGAIIYYEGPRGEIEYQIDFFHPNFQDLLVDRIVAVANCGLYDGIMFDGFSGNATAFVGRGLHPQSAEEIIAAMTSILSRVRARVHDDFLILANANRSKLTAYTEYINGTFMETGYDYATEYTHGGLAQIESTLLWSEQNLREPQINCLEGAGIGSQAFNSPANQQRMRLFTTLSLTHSDGYIIYTLGEAYYGGSGHSHFWHDFWDIDLGYPIGPKGQRYKDIPGLFIRKFTNGWAVYNRSGKAQTISLPESATGVSSKKSGITHILPDLDGEMYLKAPNPADVNGDGKINILDLIQVANSFGKSTPDPNGDGAVNILDIVFVAQQFSQ